MLRPDRAGDDQLSIQELIARKQALAAKPRQEKQTSNILQMLETRSAAVEAPPQEERMTDDEVASAKSRIQELIERRINHPSGPTSMAEALRVAQLPVLFEYPPEQREEFQHEYINAAAYAAGVRMWDTQSNAGLAFREMHGGFFPIGVGWGKTWVSFICATIAFHEMGLERIVYHLPASVVKQTINHGLPWIRRNGVMKGLPIHNLHGCSLEARLSIARSRKQGLYIMPYSLLSRPDASEVLELMDPQLIIADEAHYLKTQGAACTKRVAHHIEERKPMFVGMSGTMTSKSMMDYQQLLRWALGDNAPLPKTKQVTHEWAQVIDASAAPSQTMMNRLNPLLDWARQFPDMVELPANQRGYRMSFNRRLETTRGVVVTGDEDIGVGLTVRNHEVEVPTDYPGMMKLRGHIAKINDEWVTPTGDEIEHAIHTWKWLFELSAGFYNNRIWPTYEQLAERYGWDEAESALQLNAAEDYLKARREYARNMRLFLEETNIPGLQQPLQVDNVITQGDANPLCGCLPGMLVKAWLGKKRAEPPEGCPWKDYKRDLQVVRVCDYKVQHALRWAMRHGDGIIWYHHNGIGNWLYEVLSERLGDRVIHAPAGADEAIDQSKGKIAIASIMAHREGKNLQFHQNQLYIQFPRSPLVAQQSIGRLHRNGQEAEELFVDTCHTTESDRLNFAAVLNDTVYIQQSQGERMKLLAAHWEPPPKMVPSSVLEERGLTPKILSPEQKRYLQDLFLEAS